MSPDNRPLTKYPWSFKCKEILFNADFAGHPLDRCSCSNGIDWLSMYSNTLLATAQNVILKPLAWSGVRILVSWNRKSDADQAPRSNIMAIANSVLLYILGQSIPLEREPWSRVWPAKSMLKSISLHLNDQGNFVRGMLSCEIYINDVYKLHFHLIE